MELAADTMNTEFRRAIIPKEIRSLMIFDSKAFHEHQQTGSTRRLGSLGCLVDDCQHRKVGCCAFEPHVDFQEDIREDGRILAFAAHCTSSRQAFCQAFEASFAVPEKMANLVCAPSWFTRVVTNTREVTDDNRVE